MPALSFLKTRRSTPADMLQAPGPDKAQLEGLLSVAARVSDHGKLEPWRFIILSPAVRAEQVALFRERGEALDIAAGKIEKASQRWAHSPVVVAIVASPKPSETIPMIEQTLSAGAVCMQLINAAIAAGWGACWLSSYVAHDRIFVEQALGLKEAEFIAGFVHIGTGAPAPERPRPDLAKVTDWR